MNKALFTITILVVGGVLGGAGVWFWQSRQTVAPTSSPPEGIITPKAEEGTAKNDLQDTIVVTAPRPHQKVSSPLTISGQARGTWFFEASAPVKLVDETGTVLVEGFIETKGEWMTEEFVDFRGEMVFDPQGATSGTLILQNDNPSGIPEKSLELQIPVVFE